MFGIVANHHTTTYRYPLTSSGHTREIMMETTLHEYKPEVPCSVSFKQHEVNSLDDVGSVYGWNGEDLEISNTSLRMNNDICLRVAYGFKANLRFCFWNAMGDQMSE